MCVKEEMFHRFLMLKRVNFRSKTKVVIKYGSVYNPVQLLVVYVENIKKHRALMYDRKGNEKGKGR